MRWQEMLIIFGILLLLFGASRLPQLGSSLGSAIRNFKKGFGDSDEGGESDKGAEQKLAASSSTGSTESKDRASVGSKE